MWDRDGEKHLLWAGFHPSLDIESDTAPKGLVLVVDCSGSMGGDSMDQARMAAKGILNSLRPQDYFNIVAFGSNHRLLFSSLRVANPSNIKEALKFATNLQADLGGTELEGALQIALGFSSRKTISQDVILITDGEVWKIDETINEATKGNRRIFSIGVGSSPAESLLKTLSAKTGGACEFVFPGESMTEKILRHAQRIYSPQIKGIETIWPATPEETFPEPIQCVFDGDTVDMFAWFLERSESGNVGLLLTLSDGQTRQVSAGEVSISTTCKTPGLIARMAAALRLADMTDSDAATELAVHYQLLSRYTHCLAIIVQTEAEKAQTLPELHKVKQMLAAGWGGSGRISNSMPSPPLYIDLEYEDSNVDYCLNPQFDFPEFAERLNEYDTKSDPDLSSIIKIISSDFITIHDLIIYYLIDPIGCSHDDNLTVFLHLFLQSDYGKHLNRNISRIIKKRFKQAKLSKDLVKRISDKILPILC
jgi:Ca-activated chloride channel family protein